MTGFRPQRNEKKSKEIRAKEQGAEKPGVQKPAKMIGNKESGVTGYRDLQVWQKAMDLVVQCYRITQRFPKSEVYGLAGQIQRAAISVPSNIAEGNQRKHIKEFLQHISIAYGSLAELETQLIIANRLDYINEEEADEIIKQTSEIGKMLNELRRFVEKRKYM